MNDQTPDEPGLHVVPDPEDDAAASAPPDAAADAADTAGPDAVPGVDEEGQDDPLLARAQRIAELPLAERPAAFDGLNRALVAELQTLEEG